MTATHRGHLSENSEWASGRALVLYLVAAKFLLQLLAARNYGYFRDELYFIDCSKHLDWGYVDQPPLIAVITRVSRLLLGESLTAIRFFPALAGAVKVLLAGLIARELGGGRFAQGLAALAVLVAPAYLGADHLLTMNAFEPLFWTGCAYVLIRVIKTEDPKLWLWFGVLAGWGLENKYSMLFFGFGVFVGLLLTRQRKFLLNRWIWVAALAALIIFIPNLLWQVNRGFPSLRYLNSRWQGDINVPLTPIAFLFEQMLALQPLAFPIWLGGLWYYLGAREGESYRVLGWTYLVILSLLLLLKGRVYYLLPAYPMLLGSGAVLIERALDRRKWAWIKPAYVAALVLGGTFLAPVMLPVLPVDAYIRYSESLDLDPPAIENRKLGKLPQLYADMFGWQEMAALVARIYISLPAEQRANTAVFANNYGEAGAIDFFGPKYGLPEAICPHQNCFYWGPRNYTGESIILLGHDLRLEQGCTTEEQVGFIHNDYSMPYENFPILLCRGLKRPLKELWPDLKKWE